MSGVGAKRRKEATGSGKSASAAVGAAAGGAGAASAVSHEKAGASKRIVSIERARLLKVLPIASELTLRKALEFLLADDRNVDVLSKLVPAKPAFVDHCVLCHLDFDPLLNGPVACVLAHEEEECEGEHPNDGCFCATEYCRPDYCAFCCLRSCGGDWEGRRAECYRGPHLSAAEANRCLPKEFRLDTLAERCDACSGDSDGASADDVEESKESDGSDDAGKSGDE